MKLGIGMPIQDTMAGECFQHHVAVFVEAVKLLPGNNQVVSVIPVGASPHDSARVMVMEQMMLHEVDRVFMMDDDTLTPRGGLTKLMNEMTERKCAAISGLYLRRGYPYTSVWALNKEGKDYGVDADAGVHEITMTGLGCCLIDLSWVRKNVPQPWFRMIQNEKQTEITDDLTFFRAITKAGGKILGDADVRCTHIGQRMWINPGSATALRTYNNDLENYLKPRTAPEKAGL